jgi:diguanylate cyclase (GGDEF)-like protein/PAS domain S-box-containing protein
VKRRRLAKSTSARRGTAAAQRLAALVRHSPDAIFATDRRGRITAWNPGAERLYGWQAQEAIGGPIERIVPPDRAGEAADLRRRVFSGGTVEDLETERMRRDGTTIPVSISMAALRDPRGQVMGVTVITRDITDRARVEAMRARHAALVEHSADAIVAVDREGRITAWNHAATALYGFTEREALGEVAADLVPATSGDGSLPPDVMTGGVVRRETTRRRRDGSEVTIASTLSPIRDRIGQVTGAVGVSRDVTFERRAHTELQAAQARFQAAFEHAPIGMALVSFDEGVVIEANTALNQMLGHDDVTGSGIRELMHAEDRDSAQRALAALREGKTRVIAAEYRYLHRTGDVVHAEVRATPVGDGDAGYLVVQFVDVSDRKRFEGQLRRLADTDALTGLYNRRRFGDELEWIVGYAHRYGHPAALLAIDVDHFQYINDSYGHATGDELLGTVTALLRSRLRETDIVGRLGGDEFGVLLPQTALEDAESIGQALIEAAREQVHVVRDGRKVRATLSMGIRAIEPEAELTPAEQLAESEIARNDAKERGRDRFAVSGRDVHGSARSRALTWVERLREALENDRFVLYEQPILDLAADRVDRSELLIRLLGEDGQIVLPGAFLGAAERYGLIKAIDRWVIGRAIRLLAERHAAGHPRLGLDVNLSGESITDPTVMDFIAAEVRNAPIDPTCLIFEVTETAAIANVDRARSLARGLADLGCQFALDDFGSGFGSFYYLKHLPFDVVKIDGDFIKELPASRTDQLTVQAIVQIAKGLGKTTTAEFVSDDATVAMLREFGVDYAQGFHIGRPEPIRAAGGLY